MFRDYEIIEEIGRSQTAVVYRARKGQREFALKVFHPLTLTEEGATGAADQRAIGADLRQPFLAAAKDQKKAAEQGLRRCAPIYEAGFTDDDQGAWYASEFYPRGSLQRRIRPDTVLGPDALRALVAGVVQALLDLRKQTGRTHGNLKPANLLLGGRPGDLLRRTPLYLSDLKPGTPQDAAALERADLLALGELVLQLVTLHEVTGPNDYNYPLESSPAWDRLGKEAAFWRNLCNRLLDPKLSLEQITLEKLASQVTPLTPWNELLYTVKGSLPLLLLVLGVVAVVGTGVYLLTKRWPPATRILTVDDKSRPYGTTNPPFTGSLTPEVKGVVVGFRTLADEGSPVGTYEISAEVNDPDHKLREYRVVTNPGRLTVTLGKLTVTPSSLSRPYGMTNPPLSGSITPNRDNITTSYRTQAEATSAVGSYDIVPSLSDPLRKLGNYQVITNAATLTITPSELRIMASNQSRPLGAVNPPLTGWITPNPDGITALFASEANEGSPVGQYPIVPVIKDPNHKLANYNVSTNKAKLTVYQGERTNLTVNVDSASRSYGEENPRLTVTLDPPLEGVALSCKTEAGVNSPVGEYPILPVLSDPGNKLRNYNVISNLGVLTIKPAKLTVAANHQSRPYGEDNPPLTGSISPPVKELTGIYTTEATKASPVGSYPIVPRLVDPEKKLRNYSVTTNLGTLTITRALLTITVSNQSRIYGAANPPLTFRMTPAAEGITVSNTTLANKTSPEGIYDIVPLLMDPNNKLANYEVLTNSGKLTVASAKPDQTWAATINIDAIDFVWVDKLGAGKTGAYVAVKELSVREYTNLCHRYDLPVERERFCPQAPGNDQLPAGFETYAEAMNFLQDLNLKAKGHATFRLPSLEEYKVLVGGGDRLKLSKLKLERLKRQGEVYALMNRGSLPSETRQGKPEPSGLFHVIGNVLEWTAEGERFGVPYLDKPSGIKGNDDIPVFFDLGKPRAEFYHDYKGIRLICVRGSTA